MNLRAWTTLALLLVLVGVIAALRLRAGSGGWDWPPTHDYWMLRLDRLLAGVVVGLSLALAGALLQTLLRNPLASPDIIGVNAGAGLCVMIWTYAAWLGTGRLLGTPGYHTLLGGVSIGATVLGSLGALAAVYALSQRRGLLEPIALVLVGVMVSVIAGAATMLIRDLMPDRGEVIARWMSGSLGDDADPVAVGVTGGLALLALVVCIAFARTLDLLSLSDDEARSLGVHVPRVRVLIFVATGILSAGAVVIAGPIGFVGLVCPHVARLLVGAGHRAMLPAAGLLGVALVVGADVLVRSLQLPSGRLPIGVLTAIIGGPVFLLLLRRERSIE